jgi:hypothetical protein
LRFTYGWCFPPTIRKFIPMVGVFHQPSEKPVSNLLGGHQPSENGTFADAQENESINTTYPESSGGFYGFVMECSLGLQN